MAGPCPASREAPGVPTGPSVERDMPRPTAGRHIDRNSPRGYYLGYAGHADPLGRHDEAGLPVHSRTEAGAVYSPGDVARTALGNLELYLANGSPLRRGRFEEGARWLMANAEEVPGSFIGWAMPGVPGAFEGGLREGWFSGGAHAECLAVLVRASSLLRMPGALEAARRAAGAFATSVTEGGVLREVGDGGHEGGLESLAVFEEYPIPDRPSMTLSGHVRALWAIHDLSKLVRDDSVTSLLDRGVRGLLFVIDRYDVGYWARYDLDETWRGTNLASPQELELLSLQLGSLGELTGVDEFSETGRRFAGYATDSAGRRRALWNRFRFRLRNWESVPE